MSRTAERFAMALVSGALPWSDARRRSEARGVVAGPRAARVVWAVLLAMGLILGALTNGHAADVGTSVSASATVVAQAPISLVAPTSQHADLAALRRGARMYATYCAGCHALSSVRVGQLQDLGFSRDEVMKALNPSGAAMSAPMVPAMPASAAQAAFGVVPPDLSSIVQARGADWVYTYLRSFYTDPSRPMGANNLLVPDVAMPDVLAGLHGPRLAVFHEQDGAAASPGALPTRKFVGFKQLAPGSMTADAYDDALSDLVAYLGWISDPSMIDRHRIGPWVIGFLALFCFSSWRLARAYWRRKKPSNQQNQRVR
ncbi:cytochrome c1 [Robbsia andropogonis]|uniref:cytochrome c1 n=1 Tax=Robbsia andropogonis TaxID=28092 RepID=UPI0004B65E19|nr:cytochrome c1 [Robbsia andropogonis]MCP1120515.1 cytochrome c1 [Robbsia andropogonis]MCP1130476.1 cytochrome c1 [Robbsia andropogonis]